ncbi:hypothetical protein [Rhodoblastus sp.]|uniref:hypothetical protein n=1 Tax=Rhodoblastus sp. TaxID=1962975 RepID=UPI0035B3283C
MDRAAYAKITLADLALLVIDAIEASCHSCGANWRAPYNFLPLSTRLETMEDLLICPVCGGRELNVAPALNMETGRAH